MQRSARRPVFNCAAAMDVAAQDVDFLREIVDVYLADIPTQIAKLQAALGAGDVESAHRLAHTIKGASANIGAESILEVAAAIESAARNADLPRAAQLMPRLSPELHALQTAVENFRWEDLAA